MLGLSKSPCAENDIIEIWGYIADDSELRADSFIKDIEKLFYTLVKTPNIGKSRNELLDGLKSFPIGRYVIFYRTHLNAVEIVRVLHSARDIDSGLFSSDYLH
ncbi:MAG: type II toxin-antitoxin system RelE/ParE family toxin [Pseudomonadota bacterium]